MSLSGLKLKLSPTDPATQNQSALPVIKKPGWLARAVFFLVPVRRRVVLENLRTAFGDQLSEKEILWIAQNFYGHLLWALWEDLQMGFRGKSWLKDQIRIEGAEHVWAASEKRKGILLFTGHFGNWEFAPPAGILHFKELQGRFHILRRQLVNKWVERLLFRRFYESGLDIIPKKNSLDKVLSYLEANDAVAFIMDQHAKPEKDGVVADFFGRPAGTFKSLAMVARSTGAPVIPVYCYRDEDGKHVMKFLPELQWIERADYDEEILENTRGYNRVLEKIIQEHPEQWWWVHRRWKV